LQPLDDVKRRLLLRWSALCCAIPLCLAPLAGRSSFELAGERAVLDNRFTTPALERVWSTKAVSVARDPFMPDKSSGGAAPPQVTAYGGVVGMQVTQGDPIGFALAPNRGAGPLQDNGLAITRVSAVVLGVSPRALIDDGTRVRVVGSGDAVAGSRVASIDERGVHLQNGLLLPLAETPR
jgi:hypothetical protein